MKEVLFAMTGSVKRNSRALKQLRVLSRMGMRVQVIDLDTAPDDSYPSIPGVSVKSLKVQGSGPLFFRKVNKRFYEEASRVKADIFHASDLYVLTALSRLASRQKSALVYDSRELYPYVASTREKPWSSLYWRWVESKAIKNAALVFTVSDSIADTIASSYDIDRPTVLWNIPEAQDIPDHDFLRRKLGFEAKDNIVLHQGRIAKSRGCFKLVEAFDNVANAHCVFLGGGAEKEALQKHVKGLQLSHKVHFLAPVPNDQLLSLTKEATVGVSLLEDSCLNHRFALPNKLFEYLNASVPVLVSDLPEMSKIVESYEVGRVVDSNSSNSIAKVLEEMLSNPKELDKMSRNTARFRSEMNWEGSASEFEKAYNSLLSTNPA